jgi:hypothetical protein
MNSDKIICLAHGTVVEAGTHDELMAKNGFYAGLIQTQSEKEKKEKEEKRKSLIRNSENDLDEIEDEEDDYEEFHRHEINNFLPEIMRKTHSDYIIMKDKKIAESIIKTDSVMLQDQIINSEGLIMDKIRSLKSKKHFTDTLSDKKERNGFIESKEPRVSIKSNRYSNSVRFSQVGERRITESSHRKGTDKKLSFRRLESSGKNFIDASVYGKKNEERITYKEFNERRNRVLKILWTKNDKWYIIGGSIAAAGNGAIWPIYGIILADAINVLLEPVLIDVKNDGFNVAMMFVALAIAAGVILWMQK